MRVLEQVVDSLFLSATSNGKRLIVFKYIFFTSREKLMVCKNPVKRNASKVEQCVLHAEGCKFLSSMKREAA